MKMGKAFLVRTDKTLLVRGALNGDLVNYRRSLGLSALKMG